MAFIEENDSYKIWQKLGSQTWEGLYNLVSGDYNGQGKLGINKNLEYQIMQFSSNLIAADGHTFPPTWEEFHSFINDQLKSY